MRGAEVLIDSEIVERALSTFGLTVVNGGRRLFEDNRVRSLKETGRPNTLEAEVTEDGKLHAVTLSYGGSSWNLLCTCRVGTECKHAYAALLSLSKRFRKDAVVSERDAQSPGQRDHYFALVQNPGTLTEKETDWVERLEALRAIRNALSTSGETSWQRSTGRKGTNATTNRQATNNLHPIFAG
jgi:uncharacterized Zn finger protein